MSNGSKPGRGRRRDEQLTERVLDAALALLASGGFESLSLEGVARQAGVSRTAIYKRWPALADLVLDVAIRAMRERGATVDPDDIVHPDTGSLATDLSAFIRQGARRLAILEDVGVAHSVLAASILSPSLGNRVREELFRGDDAVFAAILESAVARREIPRPAAAEGGAMFHALVGYMLFRAYILRIGLDEVELDRLCSVLVRGLQH